MVSPKSATRRRRSRLPAPEMEALDATGEDSVERQVYKVIRQTLLSGSVAPGDKLSSRSLGSALGVSPMPIREALKRLESDGVVESRAKSAFVVRGLTQAEYREVLQLRLRLEGLAVREAAKQISSAQLAAVRRLSRMLPLSKTGVDMLRQNYRMHFYIYQCARMPYALNLIEMIWLRMGPALNQVYGGLPVEKNYEPHDLIIEALAAHDPDAAEAALHKDLLDAAKLIEPLLNAA